MKIKNQLMVLLILLIAGCQEPSGKTAGETRRPNIVFLYADDYTYDAIRALGNSTIQTPNLDRLVNGGATFTHAYNMGGWDGAVCVASRAMIMSGAFIWRARQKDSLWSRNDTAAINQTWGRLMARHGYDTYMSGKWHVKAPVEKVFDVTKNVRPGMPGDSWGKGGGSKAIDALKNGGDIGQAMPVGYNRPKNENDNTWSPSDPAFGGFWEGGKHWSEVLKDDALAFIKTAQTKESPFFMYLAFNAPHDPRQAPQEFQDRYPVQDISVPQNFLPEYPWKDAIGSSRSLRDEALAPYPRTEYAVKKHIQEYYAIITHMDQQIGKILDALEASGKMENTYIFFTGDHGLALGQHGLIGKQNLFDHSIRVPLMVAGPGIPAGKKFDQDVYLQDIMATTLELAGIKKPPYVEFNSFLDILNDETKKSHYDAIYGCYVDYQRMIRKNGYKLLVYPRINKVLLFDMNSDPKEMADLANDVQYHDVVTKMLKELVDLQKRMGDSLHLDYLPDAARE